MTNLIYTSKIYSNQNINCLLMEKNINNCNIKKPKALIDYLQTIDDVYEDYNPAIRL